MPVTKDTASFFSFYDVTEKIAIVIGLTSFGFIEELTGSMRNSVLSLMVFFSIGLIGLISALHKQQKDKRNRLPEPGEKFTAITEDIKAIKP